MTADIYSSFFVFYSELSVSLPETFRIPSGTRAFQLPADQLTNLLTELLTEGNFAAYGSAYADCL